MSATYSGSTVERSLTCDDVAGVLKLYANSELTCDDDTDCACTDICSTGLCITNPYPDNDGDYFFSTVDCDDSDDTVFPGAEKPMGIDQDCDGIDPLRFWIYCDCNGNCHPSIGLR